MENRYNAYPYPDRDPKDEKHRLLTGSPSDLREIDHYVFGGKRDWSLPFRALVAGGGTGDGLIMMAQQLCEAGVPYEIVYVDASSESCDIARARAKVRALDNIDFRVADFLKLDDLGTFDYIDCCGVLHHLENPEAGTSKLADMLKHDGGLGGMVYAPLGRTGVYPLQSAFKTLLGDFSYEKQVKVAKTILSELPETNWLKHNPFVSDHKVSDAGLFDLLLHTRDQPFWSDEVVHLLEGAGLHLITFVAPAVYDPNNFLPGDRIFSDRLDELTQKQKFRLAEELCGSMKSHIFYACKTQPTYVSKLGGDEDLIPHLSGMEAELLADHISTGKTLAVMLDGHRFERKMALQTAEIVRALDGVTSLGRALSSLENPETKKHILDDLAFLISTNLLHFSNLSPRVQ